MMRLLKYGTICLALTGCLFTACTSENDVPVEPATHKTGTGTYLYQAEFSSGSRPMNIYYHIPDSSRNDAPVLIVLHGNGRDGADTRDGFISVADERNIIILAPEFSEENFPGGDQYNLGNIFTDGDNPTPSSLNPMGDWSFSIIEPIFDDFKKQTDIVTSGYDLFGHSAGAQVAHRIALFSPGNKLERVACSAAGWYTVPDNNITFPYGLKESPAWQTNLSGFFSRKILVMVGTEDVDPDAFGLRHNEFADAQGLTRFDRAQHFYIQSLKMASQQNQTFNWEYFAVPNTGHDLEGMGSFAINRLFPR